MSHGVVGAAGGVVGEVEEVGEEVEFEEHLNGSAGVGVVGRGDVGDRGGGRGEWGGGRLGAPEHGWDGRPAS